MAVLTNCPTTAELKALIANSLAEDDQAELTAHLDVCEKCQAALEVLASHGEPFIEHAPSIPQARIDQTSAFWPVVRNLEAELAQVSSVGVTHFTPGMNGTNNTPKAEAVIRDGENELRLDFLEPIDEPGFLGWIERFKIVQLVGRGGMGLVFKAFDACLERFVAIKMLDPQLAKNSLAQERFCREARAAARIMHENVVTIHHVEEIEAKNLSYIVMQFVNGISLQDRLDTEVRLPVRCIVRISSQIASGLAAAHEQKLIHRDIKPGNVLLEKGSGRVLLTDFGLARATEMDEKLTQTGFVAGTPLFMSPEQARGETLDWRTDLFSLGGMMYAMATGKPPFEGSSPYVVLRQVTEMKHRPVHEVNPEIPEELIEIIDRLLQKDREKRIQSAQEVVELLKEVEAKLPRDVPKSKNATGNLSRLLPRWRRGWWGRYGGLFGALLLFLNVGLFTSEILGVSNFTILSRKVQRTPSDPTVNANPVVRDDPGPTPRLVLPGDGGPIWSTHFSPKGNIIAFGMDDGRVKIWDTANRKLIRDFKAHRGPVWTLQISQDGQHLATASDDGIFKVWSLKDFSQEKEEDMGAPIRSLAFSPDGTRLATGSRRGEVQVWDLESLNSVFVGRGHEGTVIGLSFSPDGKLLASGAGDKTVKLWDLNTRQELITLRGHTGAVYSLGFHPNGKQLASAGWDRTIRIWDMETGGSIRVIEGHGEDIWSLCYSHDGSKLLSGGEDRTMRLWDPNTGAELKRFKTHEGTIYSVSYSADGKVIASGSRDGKLRLWDLTD